ncbi:MAG: bifunctional oligoribonuclease/PAP phosphatase NrnA [Candidatus Gygaella obscura]|nr:bifunctional oligoribonuclease/PAP phosphatase NrnA [Candidatus Gygaella obscura]
MNKIIKELKKHNNYLVVSHINSEGDAIGSSLAMAILLRQLGKKVIVINADNVPGQYKFLPYIKSIKKPKKTFSFDAVVTVDCSNLGRIGSCINYIPKEKILINIDHHIGNTRFAKFNWVEPNASSCSEMIFKLFKKMRLAIDRKVALLLYTGIMTDTGSFKYANTTSITHRIAAELLKNNLDVHKIYKNVYQNISSDNARKIINVLNTLRFDKNKKIVYFLQRKKDASSDSFADLSEYILDFARSLKEVEIVLLFKESGERNKIRVNLRSKGKYDVNRLAKIFSGGGHKTASGCTIKGSILEAKKKLLIAARRFI